MTYAPKYTIGNTLLSHIAEIEAFRARIDGSYILPEREIAMRYRATIEATRSSTGIEGNPLNIKQVEAVLANKQPLTRHQYAELEVRNYKKALDFIDKRKHTKQPITLDDILRIHGVIMHGLLPDSKRGQLRTRDVYVVDKDDNRALHFDSIILVEPQGKVSYGWSEAESVWIAGKGANPNP